MKSRTLARIILKQVLEEGAYSNIVLSKELKNSSLNDKDKALVTEIVYGVIKYKYTLDTIIKKFYLKRNLDKDIENILRIALYQIIYLDKIPSFAAVNEAVDEAKKISIGASKLVNGILRNFLRQKDNMFDHFNNKKEELMFRYSFPNWMITMFINQYGEEKAEQILNGLNIVPLTTVRVNKIKTNYNEAFNLLKEKEFDVQDGFIAPEAISIKKGKNIEDNPLFKNGYITVQDESAMLVASSMELCNDLVVMDLCSAPGGKTTHIAEIMNNTGKVYAFDIYEHKLNLIKENVERLGISNIETAIMNGEEFNEELREKADRVLIDVPCSGLGIIRKKPEIKWNKSGKEIKGIVKIQRQIMKNASEYVKKGGYMIYSTCTINKEENEKNIQWFLKQNENFTLEKLYFGKADNIIYSEEGYVTIMPNEYMDGFFIAKLKKDGR